MALRDIAEADLAATLEGDEGVEFTVTDPTGNSATLRGVQNDIGTMIDPNTGQAVSGRQAHAVIRIATLTAAGLGLPINVQDSGGKPWIFDMQSVNGEAARFKVIKSRPDRALGVVSVALGSFADAR